MHDRKVTLTWRILPLLLVALSLACSLPGFGPRSQATPKPPAEANLEPTPAPTARPALPTPTAQPLPPAIVESDPPVGAELPLSQPVRLFFNQPMERASVEAALSIQPALAGLFTWNDDATLEFKPGEAYSPDSQISFTLNAGAKAANGIPLSNPVSLEYRTAGYLRVTEEMPQAGAYDVNPTSAVVVTFNRPVVPLGADPTELAPGFTLEPQAQGRSEWLNTSTFIFYPEPPLEGGKTYTVRLNPELRSLDGTPLEVVDEPLRPANEWSFITAAPRLVSLSPDPQASALVLDAKFVLEFNQPMDPLSIESNLSLIGGSGIVPGSFTWNKDFTQVTFTPDALLSRGAAYTLRLEGTAQARGGTPLDTAMVGEYLTVGQLAVERSEPAPDSVKQYYEVVTLIFNSPLRDQNLERYVSLEPSISNFQVYWNEYDRSLAVSGNYLPGTDYILRLSPDLPDPWGGSLGEQYSLSFSNASLPPGIYLTNAGEAIFLTAQDRTIPAQATNMDSLSTSVGSLPLADFIPMVSSDNAYELRNSYQPADQRTWQQPLDLRPDQTQAVQFYVSPDQTALAPGLYLLRFNDLPAEVYAGPYPLVVSDLQVTFKLSATDVLVWTTELDGEAAIAEAAVTIYDNQGQVLASGKTDTQGIFRSAIPTLENPYATYYAVVNQPGDENFGMALSSWSGGISPWDFDIQGEIIPPRLDGYLYTDRPIYRPGQTVYFRAVVRQAYNGRYTWPDIDSLPLTLYVDYGQQIATFDLPLSDYGTAHGEITLPTDARPGYYRLSSPAAENTLELYFQVAEYRKPEIEAEVSFSSDQALAGETLQAAVNARYYFGAPASDVPVVWNLQATPASFTLPGYQTGVDDLSWMENQFLPYYGSYFGRMIQSGEARTDAQGRLILELPAEIPASRELYTLEVTLQDESGQSVSARDTITVNPADFFIGVHPEVWVGQAGKEAAYQVQVANWEAQPAGERDLRADFQKVVWVRDETPSPDPFAMPKVTPQYTPVGSTDFRTSPQGQARLAFTPPEPGTYMLDISGGGARTALFVWVGGPGQVIWPELPNQRLELTLDRAEYLPGETAQVFIPSPFTEDALALVAIERGVVLRHEVRRVAAGGETLEVPLSSEDAPNVYLSVTLLGKGPDGQPDFRQGYIDLPVSPQEQLINVTLTGQPERAGPGEEVTFELQVTDASGTPVQGEFSLSVVDKAVLALAEPNVPDIVEAFYGKQMLGVSTGTSLAAYALRKTYSPPGMGGGGGDGQIPTVREKFEDTTYWNAEIVTGEDGRATVSLPLPDNLTTWQVLARGVAPETLVGQAEMEVLTTKDLLVRPVVPRFLVAGDHVQLAAVVQNNTGNDLDVQAALQANGVTLDDAAAASQHVFVPAGGRVRVEWWGTAQEVDSADLIFSAEAGDLTDAARPAAGMLPVLRYSAPQTFSTAGVLEGPGERLELVSLPRTFNSTGGQLDLELAPSLAAAMSSALEVLENFPYQCTEQTLSRFLPNLETYRALQEFGIAAPDLEARLALTLDEGLQSLLTRQNYDGGWGWWPGDESDTYVTAYVLFGLSRARDAGAVIAEDVFQRTGEYLRGTTYTPKMASEAWQLDRLAFSYFALAQAGQGDLAGTEALFEVRDQLSPWGQAFVALTLEQLSPGSQMARTLYSDLEASALRSATGAHWEEKQPGWQNMTTPLTTSAMVVFALAQNDPGSPIIGDAVRYLVANRRADGAWGSTYSTAWTLMALVEVIKGTGELGGNFAYSALMNNAPLASGEASTLGGPARASLPASQLYPQDPNALLIQHADGEGRLYYTVALNVNRPAADADPLRRGITVSRSYYPLDSSCNEASCAPITSAPAGDLVEVRLTLTLEEAAYYLMVEDYLPAGAEILDASLKTSQQLLPEMETEASQLLYDPSQPFGDGWGWWLFSAPRIYDERIAWAADSLPAGTYELTYILSLAQPGEYQVIPARAWHFYFPETQGSSAGAVFTIQP